MKTECGTIYLRGSPPYIIQNRPQVPKRNLVPTPDHPFFLKFGSFSDPALFSIVFKPIPPLYQNETASKAKTEPGPPFSDQIIKVDVTTRTPEKADVPSYLLEFMGRGISTAADLPNNAGRLFACPLPPLPRRLSYRKVRLPD